MSQARRLRLGVDLDNTLVCYDRVFHQLAKERHLISEDCAMTKDAVRRQLREDGREDVWTQLQGEAYGPQMRRAHAFAGAKEAVAACAARGGEIFVVSHRTRFPIAGARVDLHAAARAWLAQSGLLFPCKEGSERVFLEVSRDDKLRRIDELALDYFVDDLSEILLAPSFAPATTGIHFDPHATPHAHPGLACANSWADVQRLILEAA